MGPPDADDCAPLDAATAEESPLVTALVGRVFDGDGGLAALRAEASLPFVQRGLAHADPRVRAVTVSQLQRCVPAGLEELCERGVLAQLASAVSDSELQVSGRASALFVALAAAGVSALVKVLDDVLTRAAFDTACASASSTVGMRALAMYASMAATGDDQLRVCNERGLLQGVFDAWHSNDALVQMNALDMIGKLARAPAGPMWLAAHGTLDELYGMLSPTSDACDNGTLSMLRPSVLECLAEVFEAQAEHSASASDSASAPAAATSGAEPAVVIECA